ncbi:MAG: PKD domain-containing protein [Bacteroidetes bacterium]|nr:MAG: PKD domain-containing protein [Bacteroidota bacterium]
MKKISTLLLFVLGCMSAYSQVFNENFESYTANTYLGPASPVWTTWSGIEGGSEDVQVVTTNAASGTKSIYFNSPFGGGPNDVVLPFGGVNSSGRFKFTSKFFIPTGKEAYFNFQGGAFTGSVWALEFYFYGGGTFQAQGYATGNYPQNRWFELAIDINLDTDQWEIFIDNVSQGTFTNTNNVSYLDIFPANGGTEFWMDDISYCKNNACNPEISVLSVSVAPNPVCTHHPADVTVHLRNNSAFPAPQMDMAIDIGPDRIKHMLKLNNLAGGKDTTITIPGLFVSRVAGTNLTVKAINIQGDIVPANDTAFSTVTVNPSPSNAAISKGTPFTTTKPLTSGTSGDPDIVASGDQLSYEITPPTGFTNSSYNSTWNITGFTVKTNTGRTIASSYYTYSNPSGSTNGKTSFTPDTLLADSTVIISFKVRNISTGCDSTLTRYIYIAPRPKVGFTAPSVCDKDLVAFDNTTTIASGAVTYFWDFGDGTNSVAGQPSKTFAGPGSYTVKLVVTSLYGYKDSVTKTVNVFQIPVANFGFVNACEGTAVTMTDNSTLPSGAAVHEWDFGTSPASSATGASINKLYSTPGIYLVTLKVTVNGCTSTIAKHVTQAPRAIPDFNFTPVQCDNSDVDFTNASTAPSFGSASYLWKFGDGKSATEIDPSHTYNSYQTFNVTLISNTNLGCADSVTKSVTLRETPVSNFSMSTSTCTNQPINFTNTTTVPAGHLNTYEWEFGDGNNSNGSDPTHQYASPNTYEIVLKSSSSNGCSSEHKSTVTIKLRPAADFIAATVCEGLPTLFDNNSRTDDNEPLTYKWLFGNGDSSTDVKPSIVYSADGSYTATLTAVHPNGCTDTKTASVIVHNVPTVSINSTSANTGNGGYSFATNTAGTGYTYYWQFGDGSTSADQNPKYRFPIDGRYIVHLTVTTGDGCVANGVDTVWINVLGVENTSNKGAVGVYPNPSSGKFFVDYSNADVTAIQGITVTDVLGRVVATQPAQTVSGITEIDLSAQPTGIYYLNISTLTGVQTVKLTVSK